MTYTSDADVGEETHGGRRMSGGGIYPEKMTLIEATEGRMILSKQTFCEYCNPNSDGYVKPLEKNCHAFISYGFNGWVLSLRGGGWHGECRIKFCPMCGRELKKVGEG